VCTERADADYLGSAGASPVTASPDRDFGASPNCPLWLVAMRKNNVWNDGTPKINSNLRFCH